MKKMILLSALLAISACSKSPKSKSPSIGGTPGSSNPTVTPDITPVDVDQDQDQDQGQTDQNQTNTSSNYQSPNIRLVKGKGEIILLDRDAKRLFDRLAIAKEKRGEGKQKESFKVSKHIECSAASCVMKINGKDGEVIPNAEDKIGKHKGKFLPSLRTYSGDNLTIIGRKKDALITLGGEDAKALYKTMAMSATLSYEGEKILDTKVGVGEAPITCKKEKGSTEKEDSFSCSVKLHAATGVVEIP